ncbi:FtsB family cell division protein [Arthrobacter sp. HLT1-20]
MATRRPSVPKAQFTAGMGADPESKKVPTAPVSGTTPDAGSGGEPTPGAAKAGGPQARQRASAPTSRSHQDGVIHTAGSSPVPARRFSGRLLVLGLTMGVVTLLLAPNVHTYLQQRAEISALRDDIAAKEAQQSAYSAELLRWDDPAYIKQQARDRVSMLMPGETGYWVYGADGAAGTEDSVDAAKAAAAQATTAKKATEITVEPWVDALWGAVKKSAETTAPTAPAPVPTTKPAP